MAGLCVEKIREKHGKAAISPEVLAGMAQRRGYRPDLPDHIMPTPRQKVGDDRAGTERGGRSGRDLRFGHAGQNFWDIAALPVLSRRIFSTQDPCHRQSRR